MGARKAFVCLSAITILATLMRSTNGSVLVACKDWLQVTPTAPSGIYNMKLHSGILIQVYCEMGLNGGGYTFFSPQSLLSVTKEDLESLFQAKSSFLLRVRKPDGTQPYAVLSQLPEYASIPLNLGLNQHYGYATPVNLNVIGQPYLYFGFLPANRVAKGTVQGLQVNGFRNAFVNCDSNPSSQITLFPNFKELPPSTYSVPGAVCNNIFNNAKQNPSGRVMPSGFFMFGEMHWGGCGCYIQTNQRTDVLGMAIGFR